MPRTAIAVIAAMILYGCASTGTQIDQARLDQFKPGVATAADVQQALGPPQSTVRSSDGTEVIMYVYAHSQIKGATMIPIVGIFAGGATTQSTSVLFRFDATGKLIDYTASQQNIDVGVGSSASKP